MRRTTVFLDLGPIHPHPLTARPRGRIYSPPAGDHNHSTVSTLLRLQAKVHTRLQEHSFLLTITFFFFSFLFFWWKDELSWAQFHLIGKCCFPEFGALLEEMVWKRKGLFGAYVFFVWNICIFFFREKCGGVCTVWACEPYTHAQPLYFAPTTSLELKQ